MKTRDASLEQARQACIQNDYALAYTLYEELLQDSPHDPKVLREYGRAIYSEFGDLEKASNLFEYSLEVDPHSINALLYLGTLYSMGYGKGYSAALPIYKRIIQLDPSNKDACIDAYIGIGMLHHVPDSPVTYDEVVAAFRNAIETDSRRADAHQDLGVALLEGGERKDAWKELKYAERIFKRNGQPTEAIQRLLKSIENDELLRQGPYINNSSQLAWPEKRVE